MSSGAAAANLAECNRLQLDYRATPAWKVADALIDVHTHIHPTNAHLFFEAADLYGVKHVLTMTPLDETPELMKRWGDRLGLIAIPRWKQMGATDAFRDGWLADLQTFRTLGARLCKFWVAPRMRKEHQLTLDHPFLRPVIDHACALGYQFMTHVGDPSVWWNPGGAYAQDSAFGTKAQQFDQLEWFLGYVKPRLVIGAHMGGSVEELPRLDHLLRTHPHYCIDTSATKWIVREVSRQPQAVRAFVQRHAGRVLFGSDLVTSEKYDTLDHYASRYWAQRHLWESGYDGESPIADPDANPPLLRGVDLSADVLRQVYAGNAAALGLTPAR